MRQMRHVILATGLVALLAACDSSGENPFDTVTDDTTAVDPDSGTTDTTSEPNGISSDGTPPGTSSPTPSSAIVRYEPFSDDSGSGYATNFQYDADTDTFQVDNLPFDGDTNGRSDYVRDNQVSSLGGYAVYESTTPAIDAVDDSPIDQFLYKAIYGVSKTRNTEFAIVRTGAYTDYGFGGFVYQRNNGVTIPVTGQADYSGTYAGLRDFQGIGGLEYVQGAAYMAIDFEDFNDGDGVRLEINDRRVFDLAGKDITDDIIEAYNAQQDDTDKHISALPVLSAAIGPDVATVNGELIGTGSSVVNGEDFETGNFYAIVSGDDASEIVGIVVAESADPRFDDVTVRETGGFVVYRDSTTE